MKNKILFGLLIISCCVFNIYCKPLLINKRNVDMTSDEITEFLTKFGYMEESSSNTLPDSSSMDEMIKDVQKFAGLPQTGKMDYKTMKMMRSYRCGNPDMNKNKKLGFTRLASKWNKKHLTFRIENKLKNLLRNGIARNVKRALEMWGNFSGLRFTELYNRKKQADIIVKFARLNHGDSNPFDGPGKVLAHAYNPGDNIGGDIHFDADERWTLTKETYARDLFPTALHEVGHALGLGHSTIPNAVMYPYANDANTLHSDDIRGIRSIYKN